MCPDAQFPGGTRQFPGFPGNHWLLVVVVSGISREPLVTGIGGFLFEVGLFREVWSVSGRNRKFIWTNGLLCEQVTGLQKIDCPIDISPYSTQHLSE